VSVAVQSQFAGASIQTPKSAPLLSVRDLSVRIGSVAAVSGVSFEVARGEFLGIVGESGSGKSVTARAVLGLLPRHAEVQGSVKLDDEEIIGASSQRLRRIRGGKVGLVFQDALAALDPVYTVGDQLVEALRAHRDVSQKAARARAVELLAEVRILRPAERMDSYPHELSGGQRQRVIIACALIADPDLIIADEPTTALDVTVQRQVLELLADVCARRGAAVILITHDLGVVAETCDRVAVFYGGIVAEETDVVTLFEEPRHPYSAALQRSLPDWARMHRSSRSPVTPRRSRRCSQSALSRRAAPSSPTRATRGFPPNTGMPSVGTAACERGRARYEHPVAGSRLDQVLP
jgi:ABC-type dipeptide/oligopeptide/nickel transport system ATPase component